MKNNLLKLLILVVCISLALFAISCSTEVKTEDSTKESEIVLNSEDESLSEESISIEESQSETEIESETESESDSESESESESNVQQSPSEGLEYALSEDGTYYIVTGIGSFEGSNLVIPDEYNNLPVTEIGEDAFDNCENITSLVLGNNVTTIGDYAFDYCSIKTVNLPKNVSSIGEMAFFCETIEEIFVSAENEYFKDIDGVLYSKDGTVLVMYPVAKRGFEFVVPDGVTTIGEYSIITSYLGKLVLSDSVTTIEDWGVCENENLASIQIGANLNQIGEEAFSNIKLVEVINNSTFITVEKGSADLGELGYYALSVVNRDSNYLSKVTCDNDFIIYEDGEDKIVLGYVGQNTELVLPDYATAIYEVAFWRCYSVTSVVIGDNVTTIGESAFSSCDSLTSVEIGDSVTTIGEDAFYYCTSLTSVVIGDSVTTIGNYAFYNCHSLTSVVIGDSVLSIGTSAFEDCDSLTSVVIPDSVTTIGSSAFYNCTSLIGAYIGDSVEIIDVETFRDCVNLVVVSIGKGVTSIDSFAFGNCYKLVEVINNSNHITVEKGSYNLGHIGYYALSVSNCDDTYISKLSLSSGLIIYSEGEDNILINYIGEENHIEIPDFVNGIYDDAFRDTPYYNNEENWDNGVLYVDEFLIKAKEDLGADCVIKDGTRYIANRAFEHCSNLMSIYIPNSIVGIGNMAFFYCENIENVYFDGALEDWCKIVFKDSYSNPLRHQANLNIENQIVTEIIIPDNLYYINDYALSVYPKILKATLPAHAITKINKFRLQEVTITSGDIPSDAFKDCGDLSNVIIGSGVYVIGDGAFEGCCSLTSVTIGKNVTHIGDFAFNKRGVQRVYYNGNIESWCNITFSNSFSNPLRYGADLYINNELVTELVIPNTVTEIKADAFSGCNSITGVVMGTSVTTIGDGAFFGCSNLTNVYYKGTREEWNGVSIGDNNFKLEGATSATRYYYIENEADVPLRGGNYWHYDEDGKVAIWQIVHECSFEILKYNSTHHWYVCVCGDVLYDDYANLIHRGGTATCQDLAVCVVCGQEYGELGNHRGGTATCQDLAVCTTCGQGYGELGNHRGGTATCQDLAACTTCGQGYGELGEHYYVNNECIFCNGRKASEGLDYELSDDSTYYTVIGTGNCADTNLVIPATYNNLPVKAIGESAFCNCSSVKCVVIDDSVLSVGASAFENCYYLTSVEIGDSVTTIGEYAFYSCDNLTSVVIGNNVTTIGWCAFSSCDNLTSVVIGDSVTTIGNRAFYNCSSLTSVEIPDSVTSIGFSAFCNCSSLTSVEIPDSVTTICGDAFRDCSSLTSVYYNGDIEGWCNITFSNDSSNPLHYGADLYIDNELVTELVIPNTVTEIKPYAFYYCRSLTSVVIGDSVTTIGNRAFYNCSSLTSVVIGESVETLGYSAFYNCSSLTSVYYNGDIEGWCNITFGYDSNPLSNGADLYIDNELVTELVIPNTVTEIKPYAFYNCSSLTSVEIPDSVTSIGEDAFSNCDSLTSVIIGDSVTSIGNYAFDDCYKLVEVINKSSHITVTKGSTSNGYLGYYALSVSNCDESYVSKLSYDNGYIIYTDGAEKILVDYNGTQTDLVLPDYITQIYQYAFEDCDSLTSVVIGDSVTSIGSYAFFSCDSLTSVVIGDSVTSIGNRVFRDCYSLTSVYYTGEIEGWCNITFSDYEANPLYNGASLYINNVLITELVIPNTVTEIKYYAFYNCSSLTSVVIGESVETLGYSAFYNCSSLTSVVIPDSVTTIGEWAFSSCDSLTSMVIGRSVETIDNYAFYECDSLTSVVIPDSVTTIGLGAFTNTEYYTNESNWENGVLYIGKYLIEAKTSIGGTYTVKDGTLSIANSAFSYCDSLTSVEIPDSVTTIGSHAFSGCSSLTSVEIGDSVLSIGERAFYSCDSLTSIKYRGTEEQWQAISKGGGWDEYYNNGYHYQINYTITYNYQGE